MRRKLCSGASIQVSRCGVRFNHPTRRFSLSGLRAVTWRPFQYRAATSFPAPARGKRVDRSSSTSFCQGRGSTARTPSLTASRTSTEPSPRSTWAGMRSTVRAARGTSTLILGSTVSTRSSPTDVSTKHRWVDQVHASEHPHARHRLAILQRVREGAEGMIGRYDARPHASAIAAAVRGSGDRVVRRSSRRRSI